MPTQIKFFDTTLRDGEQTPGVNLNVEEKVRIALQLEKMGVDVIEAGFPASSPGDFKAVQSVGGALTNAVTAALCRAIKGDIDAAWESLRNARHPRIHTFIATSPDHMREKLRLSPDEVCRRAAESVAYARSLCADVEFSAEDATRSDPALLYRIIEEVIDAGASTVNIPDTVGYVAPDEYYALIKGIFDHVPNISRAVVSVHCHNDLGLAVANTLAAIRAGATQVECTVNGIGERGGNAAMEEIVMGLRTRADYYNADYGLDTSAIAPTSRLVSAITGIGVPPGKPIVGTNAFLHASGIHQHGVLANKATYEIMTPESIGIHDSNNIVLGKLSGRHAFEEKLQELGFEIEKKALDRAFAMFKETCDRKKNVTDDDITAIASQYLSVTRDGYELEGFQIQCGNTIQSTALVNLRRNGDEAHREVAIGSGPIDAAFNAVNRLLGKDFVLENYQIKAVTEGTDALGEVNVRIQYEGKSFRGKGVSTDILEASIKAYVNACNRAL